uniref:Papilin-like n=1 Tax=Phallusia mammillata TaxID=59560 RepID=A0A6F9DMI3_9ASCI|nr:papilin-like [Phallusia mammillata]
MNITSRQKSLLTLGLLSMLAACSGLSVLTLQHDETRFQENFNEGWGLWGEWHPCSRTCGGGITYMARECQTTRIDGTADCIGPTKKYSSCNIQDCPDGGVDFRSEQCATYNNQSFGGRTHTWKPYTGSSVSNPCALYCQPNEDNFFIKQADKVVDGTRCRDGSLDVCVDGTCQEVGCDMMLGSGLEEDQCRDCGGDGSSCYHVTNIFAAPKLPIGYTDILVIPPGATNIEVREYVASRNYLAMRDSSKNYVLNGNWKIDRSRALNVAGTTFRYQRKLDRHRAPESITALGPTTETIYIDLVVQGKNKGIRYSFYLPKGTNDPNHGQYMWKADEWSECSRDCGGGTQMRRLRCYKGEEETSPFLCKSSQRPARRKTCNEEPCKARWKAGNWTTCSATCNGGIRYRQVYCTETPPLSNSAPRLVRMDRCNEEDPNPLPDNQESCNVLPCPGWEVGNWSECSTSCGPGQMTREVTCEPVQSCRSGSMPDRVMTCDLGPCTGLQWVVSEWSECTEDCGVGMQTRLIHCVDGDGAMYDDRLCADQNKPGHHRSCTVSRGCPETLHWMAAEWSQCSAACGVGMQTRKVVCALQRGNTFRVFPDNHCSEADELGKPPHMKNCTRPSCQATWFTGPWSECSSTCGGGVRTRHVMCLSESTFSPLEEKDCSKEEKPVHEEICSVNPCPLHAADDVILVDRAVVKNDANTGDDDCRTSRYGCCGDNITSARGPNGKGCTDARTNIGPTSPPCESAEYGCCFDGKTATGSRKQGCREHDLCFVDPEHGSYCDQWISRWFYNHTTSQCEHFWYGGCGGNRNRYATEEKCHASCKLGRLPDSSSEESNQAITAATTTAIATETATTITTTTQIPTTTTTLATTTPVIHSTVAFHPIPEVRRLNTNRKQAFLLSTRVSTVTRGSPNAVRPALCTQPHVIGPCYGRYRRWFFDILDSTCKKFDYGGCAGNDNNFRSREACETTCDGRPRVTGKSRESSYTSNFVSPDSSQTLEKSKCQRSRVLALFDGRRPPQCHPTTGEYLTRQCVSDETDVTSTCWCVNPSTGEEISGSRGMVNCDHAWKNQRSTSPCIASTYGCCPDGIISAKGPRNLGCPRTVRFRSGRVSVLVSRGSSARLPCPAIGHPKPTVKWFKDGKAVKTSRIKIISDNDLALILTSVETGDAGRYTCVASNGVGTSRRRAVRLTVTEPPIQFRTRPTDVNVTSGNYAKLRCRVKGKATIKWYKNGRPLARSIHHSVKPWGELRFSRSRASDSGRYTCIASASSGKVISASAQLSVHPAPFTTATTTSPPFRKVTSLVTSSSKQCSDYPRYANCRLVVKAKMCRHYTKFCCKTCKRRHHKHAALS